MNTYRTTMGVFCAGLAWCSVVSAGVTTTGSVYDNPTIYPTEIRVADVGDGSLAIDDDSDLARDIVNVGYGSGHTGTATVAGLGSTLNAHKDNNSQLYVGRSGHGILNVLDGGLVDGNWDYIGYAAGSLGEASVSGSSSSWNHSDLYIGYNGEGILNVSDGGQVTSHIVTVGLNVGSTGTVTISDPGSDWTMTDNIKIGRNSSGTISIRNGATVSTGGAGVFIGYNTGSSGTATVCGAGSTWTTTAWVPFYVGYYGTGSLTLSDGGTIAADSLNVNTAASVVDVHVTGDDMIVVGSDYSGYHYAGSVHNAGVIRFYADPSLATGIYSPISESGGQPITWSGSGAYEAIGGIWNSADKTFVVSTTTLLNAGDVDSVTSGERLLFTDPGSGKTVGASFGTVPGGTDFSASLLSPAELADLAAMPEVEGQVLAGWDFTTNLTGSDVSLTFDIGVGMTDLEFWHLDGTWSSYSPDSFSYDASGHVSFMASQFSGYAVTGVPEPASLALLVLGGLTLTLRRRKS